MIGYHIYGDTIIDSNGKCCAFNDWLEWLVFEDRFELKIFYDLDQAVASLLAHIGIQEWQGKKLRDTHKLYIQGTGFSLGYYVGKVFTIDYNKGSTGHGFTYFYNAKQYVDVHHEDRGDIEYMLSKARIAQEIGDSVLESYSELGITSNSLTSPIKAFEASGLMPNASTVDDMPEEVGEYAYQCVKGNWVEAFQLGHWDEAFDYDINGAYASELLALPNIKVGRWVKDSRMLVEAVYGFVQCKVKMDAPFHPIIFTRGDMLYTPTGEWETYLTLNEIAFITEYKLGSIKIMDGWWWIPYRTGTYPFADTVKDLWGKRQESDNLMSNKVVKRILAGLWGKTLEMRGTADDPEFGPRFNPVYGAIVESNIRLKVAQACLDNYIVPLHIAVDGMIVDREFPLHCGTEMGQWRLSHKGQCLIGGSGIVGMEGKEATEDFSIRYDDIVQLLSSDPQAEEYTMSKLAPTTLSKALNTGWDKLGTLEPLVRSIHIGDETKRCYPNRPVCGGDILSGVFHSEPWDVSVITQEALSEL